MFHARRMSDLPPQLRIKARAAASNAAGRFERHGHEAFADGWDIPEDERPLPTQVTLERPRPSLLAPTPIPISLAKVNSG
jgi:hypothetical protein